MPTIAIPPSGQPLYPGHYYLIEILDFMEDGTTLAGPITGPFPV